ncbi:MAG TPA: hypothetical protein VN442_15230 [Bryobacteraceae bacterium]|nr:hypothetical protein [Bryobacteraceae bacterium]
MFRIKLILPVIIAASGILVSTATVSAKPADSAKTKKSCNFCHVDAKTKAKELTAAGKYYHEKKTLEGYSEKK